MKCEVDGCEDTAYRGGDRFCAKHYKRWKRHGDPNTILINRGAGFYINNGYRMLKINNKLVYEHIVIAEKALGRPLPPGEKVHHTGARNDNFGFCKLVICPDQAYHSLIHKRMKDLGYENN